MSILRALLRFLLRRPSDKGIGTAYGRGQDNDGDFMRNSNGL